MRHSDISSITRGIGKWLRGSAVVLVLGLLSACGTATDPSKGLLDPTAVGRFKKAPLVVPILSNLDRSIEEPNEEFTSATEVRPEDLETSSTDYVIDRNDMVNISISDLVAPGVDTVKTTRVSESGNISLPLVGPIKAVGLTESQLERAVSKAYHDANVIQNAQVSATISEARGRTFSILGAVNAPGQYVILNSDFRVLDALVLGRDTTVPQLDYLYVIREIRSSTPATTQPTAETPATLPVGGEQDVLQPQSRGREHAASRVAMLQTKGVNNSAQTTGPEGQYIQLDGKQVMVNGLQTVKPVAATGPTTVPVAGIKPTGAGEVLQPGFEFGEPEVAGNRRIIRVPLAQLRQGDLRYNIVIRPRDMVLVPQPVIGEYYMGGHVARVGVYSLTNRKITLKQAIISAGMLDQIAIPARTDIIRRIGPDKEVIASVDLDKVFAGEQPDLYLKPHDQVNVGTNALAPFMAALRGAFRFTYGFGFLYDRNYAYPKNQQTR